VFKKTTRVLLLSLFFSSLISYSQSDKFFNFYLDNLEGLSKVYNKDFIIGAAVSYKDINNPKLSKLIKKHYSSITAENEMKPGALLNNDGSFSWKKADAIMEFAKENDLMVRGHTLIWHKQTPDWFFKDINGNLLEKEKLYERLYEYIKTVMNRYKDVSVWDVVNEAISNDHNSDEIYRDKGSMWYQICGEEFIEVAFRYAHSIDSTKKLFYNDFNLTKPKKLRKTIKMLKSLISKDVPIDGIGIQAHLFVYDSPKLLDNTLKNFSKLNLDIQITELDLSFFEGGDKRMHKDFVFDKEQELNQAKAYESVFKTLKKYSDNISAVTFWGVSDLHSWLNYKPVEGRRNYPLLFNDDYLPKFSFFSIYNLK
jgi:endo-1,4-beta-xylanase